MSETVKYFGYGANRHPKMMSFITGRQENELVGRLAILQGFSIAVQKLDQIPGRLRVGSELPTAPQNLLRHNWGDSFLSYVIFSDPDGRTAGTIWDINQDERDRVRDWELVGDWYKEVSGEAVTSEGEKLTVITESIGDGQDYAYTVDGLNYETWLQPVDRFKEIATQTRQEYDQRLLRQSDS
jgi:hypothetical protein